MINRSYSNSVSLIINRQGNNLNKKMKVKTDEQIITVINENILNKN